jgi:hypothetical protein
LALIIGVDELQQSRVEPSRIQWRRSPKGQAFVLFVNGQSARFKDFRLFCTTSTTWLS